MRHPGYDMATRGGPAWRHQRGAAAVMSGIFILFIALGCAVLVIDTGRLYFEQRSLQRIADSVALDVAHQAALCGNGNTGDLTAMAQAAAGRNDFSGSFGDSGNEVLLGWLQPDAAGGRWEFTPGSAGDDADAVYVQVSRTVPASLVLGGIFGNELDLRKEAVARRIPIGTLTAGSGLASVDTQDSDILNAVLGNLTGSSLSLDAVSYQGLADAQISLADLVEADAAAGTVDELLESNFTLGEMMELFVDAANGAGVAEAGMDGLLSGGGAIRDVQLQLADILSVASPTSEAALEARAGLLDLISAAALFANQDSAVTIPLGINLTVPGLTDVSATLELEIVEAPQIAIGPPGRDINGDWRTETHTAQVRANTLLSAEADLLSAIVATANLGVELQAARSDAWFERIECSTYSQQMFQNAVVGTQSTLANINLDPDNSSLEVDVISGLATVDADLDVDASPAGLGGNSSEAVFCADSYCPVDDLPQTESTGSDLGALLGNSLAGLTSNMDVEVSISLLGIGFSLSAEIIEDALLEELLVPLLTGLDDLLMPALEALGISVGNTDVTLVDVQMQQVELVK